MLVLLKERSVDHLCALVDNTKVSIQMISLGVISHDFYLKLDESLDHSELSLV